MLIGMIFIQSLLITSLVEMDGIKRQEVDKRQTPTIL